MALSGPGNDINHQIILGYILHYLISHFEKFAKYKNFIAVPELSLKPKSDKIPDITIFKSTKEGMIPLIVFEICNNKMVKSDVDKVKQIMNNDLRIKEGFVINKNDLRIIRIFRKKDNEISVPKQSNKIETINFDIGKIIKIIPLIN